MRFQSLKEKQLTKRVYQKIIRNKALAEQTKTLVLCSPLSNSTVFALENDGEGQRRQARCKVVLQ